MSAVLKLSTIFSWKYLIVVAVVSISSALGLHLIFLLLMSHVAGPGLDYLACRLVVFETSQEVVRVNVEGRQFLGKQIVCSVADDQVDNLEESSQVRRFLRISPAYSQCQ